jgi:myo-inositol-1-phosphate synthase
MTRSRPSDSASPERVGLWLVGARGAISTCVAHGLSGLRQGLLDSTGLVTARGPLAELPLLDCGQLVLGGWDVCRRPLSQSASELADMRVLSGPLVAAAAGDLAAFEQRLRAGILDPSDGEPADLDPQAASTSRLTPRQKVARLLADLNQFQRDSGLARVVVVHVASTEIARAPAADWSDLASFERALDDGRPQPASVLYAYAAISGGFSFVNFTPNVGSAVPALQELARSRGVAHCGNDGKTGETLVKTALAPLFVARNLKVLAWQGYNMLGNRDGEVLADPLHRAGKLRSKSDALRAILEDPGLHHQVAIDFVPSLRDWKTAWDFVHFEGFLGAQMSLQFTWQGSDSALAAPLVIDLVRLTELAQRRGEAGVMEHTASFFKSPIAGGSHDFHQQFRTLIEYAQRRG